MAAAPLAGDPRPRPGVRDLVPQTRGSLWAWGSVPLCESPALGLRARGLLIVLVKTVDLQKNKPTWKVTQNTQPSKCIPFLQESSVPFFF